MFASFRFAPEWTVLAVVALVDLVWAQQIGFHLVLGGIDALVFMGPLSLLIAVWALRAARAALVLEFFCLSLTCSAVFGVFSYLSLASARGPLWDAQLLAADRALGFDW